MMKISRKADRDHFVTTICALLLLSAGGVAWGQETTSATQSALSATTGSLRLGTEFFDVESAARMTTLPVTSVVMGETSITAEQVTAPVAAPVKNLDEVETATQVRELMTSEPMPLKAEDLVEQLPIKVDKSSTMSQELQVQKFERRNMMGEAYLLARELVRNNPGTEFALNAAIRTSLVLGLQSDSEALYREAIRVSVLPGKYYVQLAHFYARTGKTDLLSGLITEYERDRKGDPDYWISLARLAVVADETLRAQVTLGKASAANPGYFPLVWLTARVHRDLREFDKSREVLLGAVDGNFGPWEKRSFFIEFLKLPGNKPSEIGRMIRSTMVNEADYAKALGLGDLIIRRAMEERLFAALKAWLNRELDSGNATGIEYWLAARMALREGVETEALDLLTSASAGNTPVVAYERARALAAAGRAPEAIPILNILLAEQPTDTGIRLMLAEQNLATTNPQEALEVLAPLDVNRVSPEERKRLCELAMSAALRGGTAAQVLDTWVELASAANFSDLQVMGDIVLRSLTDDKLANELVTRVDRRLASPDQWQLLLLRARVSAANGLHAEEMEHYARYLENDWDNVQMLRFVAELATQYATAPVELDTGATGTGTTKDEKKPHPVVHAVDFAGTELAMRIYRRLIELQPMIPDNYSALMRLLQVRGEVETAKKVALELADRNTSSAKVQAMAAGVLDENGFAADALHFYETSLNIDPNDYEVWLKYADALRVEGALEKSEAIYRRIFETGLNGQPYAQPELFAAMLRLANDAGKLPALLDYLDACRDRDIPGKAEFYLSASKLFMQVKAEDRAEKFLKEMQQKLPESPLLPDSYLLLGQLYYVKQDAARALEAYRAVVEKFPDSHTAVTARFNIGEVHRQAGEGREAVTAWVELANRRPDDDKALAGMYEAALVAYGDLKDPELSKRLLRLYVDSGAQDFALVRKARAVLARVEKGQPPIEKGKE